jgi:hypothetical protein
MGQKAALLLKRTIADLIGSDVLEWTHGVKMPKSKPDTEEHGEALVDVSFGNRARIQRGLSILTNIATTIYISASVQNVGHALLLGVS